MVRAAGRGERRRRRRSHAWDKMFASTLASTWMTKVILTRHGHVEGISPERFRGRTDLPLTELGQAQAKAVATRIARAWNRLTDPSENRALEFKGEFPRFENSLVSATIGINWSICGDLRQNPRIAFIEKRPSALAAMINWMKFRPVRLGCDHWVRASSLTATCNNGGAAWRWRIENGGEPRLPS
jgi:hypothetical protein